MSIDPTIDLKTWVSLEKRRRALWAEMIQIQNEQNNVKQRLWTQIPSDSRKKMVIQPSSGGTIRFVQEATYTPLSQRFLRESLRTWNRDLDIDGIMKHILSRREKIIQWNIHWLNQK